MGTSVSDNDDVTDCQYVRCAMQVRKLSFRQSSTTQYHTPEYTTIHIPLPPENGCKLKLAHVSNKRLPWHSTRLHYGNCHVSMHLSAYVPRDSQLPLVPLFLDNFPEHCAKSMRISKIKQYFCRFEHLKVLYYFVQ